MGKERKEIADNFGLAVLFETVSRRLLRIREVNLEDLKEMEASHEGYLQILDVFFASDPVRYNFGAPHVPGPNWFGRTRANMSILKRVDASGKEVLYQGFAVSGTDRRPGAPVVESGDASLLHAEPGRQHDAEFKVLNECCQELLGRLCEATKLSEGATLPAVLSGEASMTVRS